VWHDKKTGKRVEIMCFQRKIASCPRIITSIFPLLSSGNDSEFANYFFTMKFAGFPAEMFSKHFMIE
jgi:hypothetical protein